jgi:tetratricopeptide (TPR) repeat protein
MKNYCLAFLLTICAGASVPALAFPKESPEEQALVAKAAKLVGSERIDPARAIVNKILKLNPRNARAWYLLGVINQEDTILDGTSKAARDAYRKALEIYPGYGEVYRRLGELAGIEGNWQEEIRYCDKALAAQHPDIHAYKSRAIANGNLHKDKEALADFDKYIAARKGQPFTLAMLNEYPTFLENAGAYDKALAQLRILEQINKKPSVKTRQAKILVKMGKINDALAIMNKMIQAEPEDETLYADRAEIYKQAGRNQEALKDWDKVISIEPNSKYYESRAAIYDKLGMKDKARADRAKGLSLR